MLQNKLSGVEAHADALCTGLQVMHGKLVHYPAVGPAALRIRKDGASDWPERERASPLAMTTAQRSAQRIAPRKTTSDAAMSKCDAAGLCVCHGRGPWQSEPLDRTVFDVASMYWRPRVWSHSRPLTALDWDNWIAISSVRQ